MYISSAIDVNACMYLESSEQYITLYDVVDVDNHANWLSKIYCTTIAGRQMVGTVNQLATQVKWYSPWTEDFYTFWDRIGCRM